MSILKRIKDSVTAGINEDWSDLTNINELDKVDQLSNDKPVILFKHSVTCGISSGAKYRLESDWNSLSHDVHFYYLDLLSHRNISNAIAKRYNVVHQSPQILIIRNGNSIYDTSHHRISIRDLNDAIEKHA